MGQVSQPAHNQAAGSWLIDSMIIIFLMKLVVDVSYFASISHSHIEIAPLFDDMSLLLVG